LAILLYFTGYETNILTNNVFNVRLM